MPKILKDLPKQYTPFEIEEKWAKQWVEDPYKADATSEKPAFCIVIPPPNVNGNLHLGHAFDNSIIDTLIRFKRMQGYEVLYQPGMDHAGITTQVQVEKMLHQEGLSRYDLGREKFLDRVWQWKEQYGGIILGQLQRLGVSADWSRTRFTLDEGLSKAVRKQFVDLYHQGHVYKGERIVNWDPASQTVISELEVDREERLGKLHTLAYSLEEGGQIEIATVRPETIFADVAIAVHPEDARFTKLVGKKARIPLTDRYIPIITDEAVEMDFGTGALKITPAHDPTDFEIGERHKLAHPSVIDLEAKLYSDLVPERFRGLERFEARRQVTHALAEEGFLLASKDHTISIGLSQRTKEVVEPIVSKQWFYNTDTVAQKVLEGLDNKDISLFPERYTKVNKDWLKNLRHWCISRQLWWGHQIPAWYDEEGNIYVPDAENPFLDPPDDPRYEGLKLKQDPDVFDTWFSSNLWPFSTLGWPDESSAFYQKFYPTSVLVTGYDILFFWVTRMEMAGYQFTGQKPFDHVFLHGLVLDEKGQKMSKSKGNGIDPLELIQTHGADALRFAMSHVSTGGQDIRWDPRRVDMGRNFNNKLWNASRFVFMHLEEELDEGPPVTLADRWIMSLLQQTIKEMTQHLEAYDLGMANRTAYDFVWSEFCDWYLESAKVSLYKGDARTRYIAKTVLSEILKLLHPLIPFISSELYEALGEEQELGKATWPEPSEALIDREAQTSFKYLKEAVTATRNLRAEANLSPGQNINIYAEGPAKDALYANQDLFESLAKAKLLGQKPEGASLSQLIPDIELSLPFAGLIDVEEWKLAGEKRLKGLAKNVLVSEKKLNNPKFVENAPEAVVKEEKRRLAEAKTLIAGIEASLAKL